MNSAGHRSSHRVRLFAGLILTSALILAMGVLAARLLAGLANRAEEEANRQKSYAVWLRRLAFELASMDRGLLLTSAGDESGRTIFTESQRVFERALEPAPRGRDLPPAAFRHAVVSRYAAFSGAADRLLRVSTTGERARVYRDEVLPSLARLDTTLAGGQTAGDSPALGFGKVWQEYRERLLGRMLAGVGAVFPLVAIVFLWLERGLAQSAAAVVERDVVPADAGAPTPLGAPRSGEAERSDAGHALAVLHSTRPAPLSLTRPAPSFEDVLIAFPDPVFVLDSEGRVELANPVARVLAGRQRIRQELSVRLGHIIRGVFETGESFLPARYEHAVVLPVSGTDRCFLPRVLALRDFQDRLLGVTLILSDVTHLRGLDQARSGQVATASHELKTPLTSLRMALRLLCQSKLAQADPRRLELLQVASDEAESLSNLLNDLLDLARSEAGENGLDRTAVNATELVTASVRELRAQIAAKRLTLTWALDDNLPPLHVDPRQMALVFRNLVGNAVKHSHRGGEIVVRGRRQGEGAVRFSVMDHGPGLPPRYRRRVFDRFFRVPGHAKAGTGLGLSIAREAVMAHGGRIGVRSRPGHGCEFYFTLPISTPPQFGQFAPIHAASRSLPEGR